MSDFAGIWVEDEKCLCEPIEVSSYKGGCLTRQGPDVHTLSPQQIARLRAIWDEHYPDTRPKHLMPKPNIGLATKQMMSIALMLSFAFVYLQQLPPSIRFHYGRKHIGIQVSSVMPLAPSPFFHNAEST